MAVRPSEIAIAVTTVCLVGAATAAQQIAKPPSRQKSAVMLKQVEQAIDKAAAERSIALTEEAKRVLAMEVIRAPRRRP